MTAIDNDPSATPGADSALRKYLAEKQTNAPAAAPKQKHNPTESPALRAIANTLSGIFSPLFVPTFTLLLALWVSPLASAPESARLLSSVVIFLVTAIIPLGVIIGMMRAGKVSDLAISDRRQRTIPFAVTAVCYVAAGIYLHVCRAPGWLCLFFVGAAVAAVCALVISLWWKISAHALAMGGMCGMLVWLALNHRSGSNPVPLLIAAIVLSGAVASSRVYLERHTAMQTYAGWLLALVLALATMSLG